MSNVQSQDTYTNDQFNYEEILDSTWHQIEYSITEAKELLKKAEVYLKHIANSESDKVKFKIVQAALLTREERFEEVLPIILEANQLSEVLDNKWRIRLLGVFGVASTIMGERVLGLEQLEKMWQLAIEEKDTHNEALALHDIAVLFSKVEYYAKAKELWQSIGYNSGVVACLYNPAINLLNKQPKPSAVDIQEVIELGKEAIEFADSPQRFAACHYILAEAYAYKNNKEESLKHINLFKDYIKKDGSSNADLFIIYEARVFQVLEEHESVIEIAQRALHPKQAKLNKQAMYKLLAKSCAALNDYEQAYNYQAEFIKLKDEIYNEESTRKTRLLNVVHETNVAKQKALVEQEKAEALHSYVEKLEKLNAEIKEISLRDPLTGLFNRRHLMDELNALVDISTKYQRNLCLVILDADHFKQVNDTFGHSVGDTVLKVIAQILKDEPRKSDLAARYGGEEFTIVLPETTITDAVTLSERIRLKIQEYPWDTIAPNLKVTASMGVGHLKEQMTPEDLLNVADELLYQAKEAGRNCVKADVL